MLNNLKIRPTVLFINWTTRGRDIEIDLPLFYFCERVLGWEVKHVSMFNLPMILQTRPDLVLMPNTTGGARQVEIARLIRQSGIPLFSHVSEGMFREEDLEEFVWGAGKSEKILYEELCMYWSQRCVDLALNAYPELVDKLRLSGAVGFDKYSFLKVNKIKFKDFKKYIGFAGFDYHNLIQKKEVLITSVGLESFNILIETAKLTNEILTQLIIDNPDICFLLKSHPGDGPDKTSLEFIGLEKYENAYFVDKKTSILDVIGSSDIWLSYNSSTNLEAWLLKKPSISFLTNEKSFSSNLLYGAVNSSDYNRINQYIDEYYSSGKLIDFDEKINFRETAIKEYIGYADGLNHVRYMRELCDYLQKSLDIGLDRKWKVDWKIRLKAYSQHFLYSLSRGMFKTPFLKNWSEYYYIYDELELETKKNSWFQDLDVFHKVNEDAVAEIFSDEVDF